MRIDDADVRDLGLDLEHTAGSTELRLPSAIGAAGAAVLGFFGLVGLSLAGFLARAAWAGPEPSIAAMGAAAAVAVGAVVLLRVVSRWLRYGAVVRIAPGRLTIRRHWSSGEDPVAIELDRVEIESDRRGSWSTAGGVGSGSAPGWAPTTVGRWPGSSPRWSRGTRGPTTAGR